MNNQEIFETISRHLFAQGQQAKDSAGRCRYRTDNGLKCSVGCLIPDDIYQESMEGSGPFGLRDRFSSISKLFTGWDINLLSKLQTVHDCEWNWESTEIMRETLESRARLYNNIDTNFLNELSFEDR